MNRIFKLAAVACLVWAAAYSVPQPARAGSRACLGIGDKALPQPEQLPGYRTLRYSHATGRPLLLHVLPAKGLSPNARAPAILLFFGGGWLYGSILQFDGQAHALASRGIAVVLVDYRVLCRDDTGPLAGMADAAAAMRFVRTHANALAIDPHRIAAGGGSAGGQLALSTAFAADPAVHPDSLVLFNPVVDLDNGDLGAHFAGLTPSARHTASPVAHESAAYPPMLIMHGIQDRLVPISQVRAFCAAVSAHGRQCTLLAYPGAGHGFFNPTVDGGRWQAATIAAVEAFLDRTLVRKR